jgi:hypothetical protein
MVTALALVPGPVAPQEITRRFGTPSEIVAGQKVRVSMDPEFGLKLLPFFEVGMRPVRIIGTVQGNWAPDSMRLDRTALLLYPWESRHRTVFWGEVRNLDLADGRLGEAGAVRGAIAGFGIAVVTAAFYSVFSHIVCFDSPDGCGPGFGTTLAVVSVVTVPTCAIWGSRSTKWSRVY